jgi:hypothetical protein
VGYVLINGKFNVTSLYKVNSFVPKNSSGHAATLKVLFN